MRDIHPFWNGFLDEAEKVGFVEPSVALQYAAEHPIIAGTAVGLPIGLAAVGVKRLIQRRLAQPQVMPPAQPTPGRFGPKGLAIAALAGGLGGYILGRRNSEK